MMLKAISVGALLAGVATAAPSNGLKARQDIDFDLVDLAPQPTKALDDTTGYNPASAISAVVADITASPVPQEKRSLRRRSVVVSTYAGYSNNVALGNAAINAPLDCNKADTYMGAKIFTSGPFDTTLCAAACSAQSAYNLRHPPSTGAAKTCQFYNTYALYKNDVYQGQYCSMYTESWAASYATNVGQYRGTDKYTISDSYMSSNATNTGEVSCPGDIPYLSTNGADFCTSYIAYVPPTVTQTSTVTPGVSTILTTEIQRQTDTVYVTNWQTNIVGTTTVIQLYKRAVQTPASVSSWSPSRISAACSAVATGTSTTTATVTAATPYTTLATTKVVTEVQSITVSKTAQAVATSVVRCERCPTLIQNPSFENGWNGWTVTGTQPVSRPGTNGNNAIGAVLPTNGWTTFTQDLKTVVGGEYSLTTDYWFSAASTNCYLNAFIDGQWFWSFSPRFVPSSVGNWKTGVGSFKATQCTTSLSINFLCTGWESVEIRLDNILKASGPTCAA